MTIRPKTVRRLLILCATAAVIGGSVTTAFYARRQARDARAWADRSTGISAYATGDFATALPSLKAYVAARPDDVEALFALAASCERADAPNGGDVFEARTRFQQVLLRDPANLPAKRRLLAIHDRLGVSSDLLRTADEILAATPADDVASRVEPLRLRAVALSRQDRHADAAEAWRAYTAIAPLDFRAQGELLAEMRRAGATSEQVVTHARGVVATHPENAGLRLPLANALRDGGFEDEARTVLAALAADPPRDAAVVVELVATLDRTRSFEQADRVLAAAAESLGSADLNAALAVRAWQNGRHDAVLLISDGLFSAGRRDAAILGLRAMSLAALDRRAEAETLIAELAARPQDAAAKAWADALGVELAADARPSARRVAALREAVAREPANGLFYAWLGRELIASGEADGGTRCLREAAQRMPSWAAPCVDMSKAFLAAGRIDEAAAAAKAGYLRAPTAVATQLQVVQVRYAELMRRADPDQEAALLRSLLELRERLPEEASLKPIHASLLARGGRRDEAEQVVRGALANIDDPALLADLYRVAQRGGLAATEAIADHAVARRLASPGWATMRAADLADRSGAAAAVAFVRALAAAHPGRADWALAEARVRLALKDAGAADAWKHVVSAFPDDATVQAAALEEAPALIGDRSAQAALVERLRGVQGGASVAYRLAQVRFLSASTDAADVRQALSLATDLVREQPGRAELRLTLARLLIRLDGAAAAIDHLRAASDAAPGDAGLGLELAGALRKAGRVSDAAAVLVRLGSFDFDAAIARRAVAGALVDAGLIDAAAQFLTRAEGTAALDEPTRLMLAEVQATRGDLASAASTYAALAAKPDASPASLASAAAFERRANRAKRSAQLLARLKTSTPAHARALAAARYAASFGEDDAAREAYALATGSDEADASTFREAVQFELARGTFGQASELLARGLDRFPDDAALRRSDAELAAIRGAQTADGDASLAALLTAGASDPAAGVEADALRALADARVDGRPTPRLAALLAQLVTFYPSSLALNDRAIEAAIGVGDREGASNLAFRLLAQNAGRAEATALAARTLARCGQYAAARVAATDWRRQSTAGPRDPDGLLAAIALAGGDTKQAFALLEPHRSSLQWPRDKGIFATLAEAYLQSGETTKAFTLLEPALIGEPAARAIARSIALRGEAGQALQRLQTIEAATPINAQGERLELARAYLMFSQWSEDTAALAARGLTLLPDAAADRSSETSLLRADLQRANNNAAEAIVVLRDALKAASSDPALKNALAYLLLDDPVTAAEAERLAGEAVASRPGEAGYLDTLARACSARGDVVAAEKHFRAAIKADADCLDALVGLAALHARLGRVADAQVGLKQVDERIAASRQGTPSHLRHELATSRQRMASTRD